MFKKNNFLNLLMIMFCVLAIMFVSPVAYGFKMQLTGNITKGSECPEIFNKFIELILPGKRQEEAVAPIVEESVYVSGFPIGFSVETDGVIVVSLGEIYTNSGYIESPSKVAGIKEGDIVTMVEGQRVTDGASLITLVNEYIKLKPKITVKVLRNNEEKLIEVEPYLDDLAGSYRLGLWVRDNAIGVGTLTYIKRDGTFSALGHPIADFDTNIILPVGDGKVYRCSIIDIKKGVKGEPGELKGLFLKSNYAIGEITTNTDSGITGSFINKEDVEKYTYKEVGLLKNNKVKPGKVKIISTIDGSTPSEFDAEIIKTNYSLGNGQKCMIIRVTDDRLIGETGGIVQGMSGSPVLQDGKLIGCITHVFINDPTKGFVDYIS